MTYTKLNQLDTQLFKQQGEFFDGPSSNMTPLQVREKLANIAAQVITEEQLVMFKDLLKLKPSPNGGIGVTDDLKYTSASSRFCGGLGSHTCHRSQVRQAEWRTCFSHCPLGRFDCKSNL